MNKEEMVKVIDRYAVANGEKNTLSKEVAELNKTIKAYFTARQITIFDTDDNVAIINYQKKRTLDADKLAAHFGGVIPEEYYTQKESPVLTVKPRKPAQAVIDAIHAA